MSEVERRKAYGDWLRENRTGGLDQDKLAVVDNNHEDKTKTSPVQYENQTKTSLFHDDYENITKKSSFQYDHEVTKTSPFQDRHEHKTKSASFQYGHEDKSKVCHFQDGHEVKTKKSPFQRVPHPPDQGSDRAERCTSAVPGRRKRGEGLNPRLQVARPLTSKANRMGTRLEPQGADRFDPVPELDHTVEAKSKEDSVENGPEITPMEMPPENDFSQSIVPGVGRELEDNITTSSVPNSTEHYEDVRNVPEDQASAKKRVRPRTARGPRRPSSGDPVNIAKSESPSQLVQTTGSNSYLEEQKHSPAERVSGEEQLQEREDQRPVHFHGETMASNHYVYLEERTYSPAAESNTRDEQLQERQGQRQVHFDGETTTLEERQHTPVESKTETEESQEIDEHRPSSEDGQEKTPDVVSSLTAEPEPVRSSSSSNINNNIINNNDNNNNNTADDVKDLLP